MPPSVKKVDDVLEISLSGTRGGEFGDCLEKIRAIPGRRYDGERKLWLLPAEPDVAHRVVASIKPKADATLLDWIRDSRVSQNADLTTPLPEDAELPELSWAHKREPWQPEKVNDEEFNGLFDFQRAAVDKLASLGRAILADDMGLGKTIQAIAAVQVAIVRKGLVPGPKLIVCPNSVKGSWARELKRWLGPETVVRIIDGTTLKARHNQLESAVADDAWVIINWDQLVIQKKTLPTRNGGTRKVKVLKDSLLEKTNWTAVIADEAHWAKNYKALRTLGLWRTEAPIMFALTGTPVMNAPHELWPLLRWLWPEQYNSNGMPGRIAYWTFYNEYVDAWEDPNGRNVIVGVKNPDALRFELSDRLIRRTSGQVRTLPGRRRIYLSDEVALLPKQRKLYEEAEHQMWVEVTLAAQQGDANAKKFLDQAAKDPSQLYRIPNGAARLVRLQQIIETPALLGGEDISSVLDDFEERFDGSRPEQWVFFTKFKGTCDCLAERLRKRHKAKVGVYYGDVDPADRTELEDRFQIGDLDVMVGTIATMKEGITLTAAHLGYFATRDWVDEINEQCERRYADRVGQQHKATSYVAMPPETVSVSKVKPANELKDGIVRTLLPKDHVEEVHK